MSDQFILDAADRIAEIRQEATAAGIANIHIETDFKQFRERCLTVKGSMHPQFDPMFMDILPHQGFWIWGEGEKGELVHTQAMRLDDLGQSTLCDFLKQNLSRLYEGEMVDTSPQPKRLTGKAVYHGEMWISESLRGQRLAPKLSRMAHAAAVLKWQPDFIYGFMEPEMTPTGFSIREGYAVVQPSATVWENEPDFRPGRWLVLVEREQLYHALSLSSETYDV